MYYISFQRFAAAMAIPARKFPEMLIDFFAEVFGCSARWAARRYPKTSENLLRRSSDRMLLSIPQTVFRFGPDEGLIDAIRAACPKYEPVVLLERRQLAS